MKIYCVSVFAEDTMNVHETWVFSDLKQADACYAYLNDHPGYPKSVFGMGSGTHELDADYVIENREAVINNKLVYKKNKMTLTWKLRRMARVMYYLLKSF